MKIIIMEIVSKCKSNIFLYISSSDLTNDILQYVMYTVTKNVIGSTTHVLEEGIQAVTGNEEYNFGGKLW